MNFNTLNLQITEHTSLSTFCFVAIPILHINRFICQQYILNFISNVLFNYPSYKSTNNIKQNTRKHSAHNKNKTIPIIIKLRNLLFKKATFPPSTQLNISPTKPEKTTNSPPNHKPFPTPHTQLLPRSGSVQIAQTSTACTAQDRADRPNRHKWDLS